MHKPPTYHTVVALLLTLAIVVLAVLMLVSCTPFYKLIGMSEEQIAGEKQKDVAAAIPVLEEGRQMFWQLASAAIAALGTLASGLLGNMLRKERKISGVMIRAIEDAVPGNIKEMVLSKATAAGVEDALDKRVQALT